MSAKRRLITGIAVGAVLVTGVAGLLVYRRIPRIHFNTAPETKEQSVRNLVRGFETLARAHAAVVADRRSQPAVAPAAPPAAADLPPEAPAADWEALGDKMTRELAASAGLSPEEQLRVRHVLISVGHARELLEQNLNDDRLAEQEASLIRVAETQLRFVVPRDKEDAVTTYFTKQQLGGIR